MRTAALVATLLSCAGFAATASAKTDFRDRVASPAAAAATGEWGGATIASDGEKVSVFLSDSYPVDPARQKQWADYLTTLVHGKELSTVTVRLETPSEVQTYCGRGALACYSPHRATITAPADDPEIGITARGVLAHEYGHHIAASRVNPPFESIDYGTKRWATYEDVCLRTEQGDFYPGGEDDDTYALNPGEAFAETYRVLNEQKLGMPLEDWLVDNTFFPDPTALSLLEQDIVNPWTRNTTRTLKATLTRRTTERAFTVRVPYDGVLSVAPRQSGHARVSVSLLLSGRLNHTRRFSGKAAPSVSATACGDRKFTIRAKLLGQLSKTMRTTVTLAVSAP